MAPGSGRLGEGCGTLVPLSIYFAPEEIVVIEIRVHKHTSLISVELNLHLPLDYLIRWDYIVIRGRALLW